MRKKEGDAENRSRLLVNKTSMRILVVDDEPDINTTLEKALEQNGFKVDSYECPLMALENFTPYYYDLAILDIKMPEMNGFSFYREIKKLDKNLRILFSHRWRNVLRSILGYIFFVTCQLFHSKAYWQ